MHESSTDEPETAALAPPGVAPVTSWIISRDTEAELAFLAQVFAAIERPGTRIMNGEMINHVEVDLSGTAIMMFDAPPEWPVAPAHTRVYVRDLAATLDRARARGARMVTRLTEMPFGDVIARFRDPQGHLWWVHEHVEDVSIDEMTQRFGLPRYVEALAYVGKSLAEEMSRPRS